jgi:hypothetical protein
VIAPGIKPSELFARKALAEHVVGHQLLGRRLSDRLLLDAKVAQHLHGPLIGDVGARGIGQPAVFRDHHMLDAVHGEQCGRGAASRSAADHQHVGFDLRSHHILPHARFFYSAAGIIGSGATPVPGLRRKS